MGFNGWAEPIQNWSKLPHQFIELMADMTMAELKVTIYLLRHTWGYSNFTSAQAITLDEFMSGRKDSSGRRIDNGTGMAKQSVLNGLAKAEERGTIKIYTDDTDKARIKKRYVLNIQRSKNETADVQILDIDLNKEKNKESSSLKKERKLSKRQEFLKELEEHFSLETKIPIPNPKNQRDRRGAAVRWWNPLHEIYELYGKQNDKVIAYSPELLNQAKALIFEAVYKMKTDNLTISAPQSILQVAISLYASQQEMDAEDRQVSNDWWEQHI